MKKFFETGQRLKRSTSVQVRADETASDIVWFTITTERQASDRGILIADGMDHAEYDLRPFVFLMHDRRSPMGKGVELKRVKDGWDAAVQRAPANSISDECSRWWEFIRWAGFGAASIEFSCQEVDWEPSAEELAKYGASGNGWIGRKWTLDAWAIVSIQADPGALMHSMGEVSGIALPGIEDGEARRALIRSFAFVGAREAARAMTAQFRAESEPPAEPEPPAEESPTESETPSDDALAKLDAKLDQALTALAALAEGQTKVEAVLSTLAEEEATSDEETSDTEETNTDGEHSAWEALVNDLNTALDEVAK